ncbi:O-methyltransferase [Comamonas terrigena]|uniref:O-methyltransferase n=1 Tax=Comamonas terrigena TaxID=32013 RepID=UPI0024484B1F|nr:O-methyltransferase [Comamonas terrigena]MDH1700284.1 hypothetical protein [Comamonas terrigena]
MSGGSISYHLRENKAIERNLFIDLLSRIGRYTNISDYTYVGFGGPFREDFKAIHSSLRIEKMISIEMDSNVFARQNYNYPARMIEAKNCTSSEFIDEFDEIDGNSIFWLDYTQPKELKNQITDFRNIISKMQKFDVAKITLNAHSPSLGSPKEEEDKDSELAHLKLHEYRAKVLATRVDSYWNGDIESQDVLPNNYPATLLRILKNSLHGLQGRIGSIYFQPLASYTYQDGVKMLTLTGVILDANNRNEIQNFIDKTRIGSWPYNNLDWSDPKEISVPSLSARERMEIDAMLPLTPPAGKSIAEVIEEKLGFVPSTSDELTKGRELLENYARYYRAYPFFSRVWL